MPRFSHPLLVAALLLAALSAPLVAQADESGGDSGGEVRSKVPNAQLQKELAVLQFKPEAASEACINSLKDLHKTQDQLEEEQKHTNDQDLAIAQDVLESDFENSIEMCAPDVRALCETPNPDIKLAQACERLGSLPDGPSPEN
ncbi:hypothetical protein [Acetobacter indonesiensis]|uniref:Secreted protein n=1 Tax=Acetobacter indonesiensis TaxID=104101 RepID=A0A6N3T225_9PROT|nr:hypothetical protein [Acetobacter indonesiensis]MCG0994939.1 hypothetical protein [Acetobacter indonesiensis]MCI1437485.1 hypothetical protein [Acetobacter indonesiensis]MCI1545923.1 hypothetical protein [Acetobacter indonesiensis]MCI1765062.1 hypothetical protein [Acetobacter indonesiensis]MCP1230168.1 hypothetical protein [Acetobacter indonesiensis]